MEHVKANDLGILLGDVDTVFGPHDVRRPDIVFFQKSRLHLVSADAIHGPPDLCVQIISPTSGVIDRRDKFKLYQAGNVVHYWIVDPAARTIEAFVLREGKYEPVGNGAHCDIVRLPPFPDLPIPLAEIWFKPVSRPAAADGTAHRE